MRYVGENAAVKVDHRVDYIRYDLTGSKKAVFCSCGWVSSYHTEESISLDAFNQHRAILRDLRHATGSARYRDWKIRHGFYLQGPH